MVVFILHLSRCCYLYFLIICCGISYFPIRKVDSTLDTSSKGFVTEVWKGWRSKKRKGGCVWRSKGEKGLLPKDKEAASGLESRSLHSQPAAGLLLQLTRNQKPALRWWVLWPAVLPRCSLLLQTDQKGAKSVSFILPSSLQPLAGPNWKPAGKGFWEM